MQKKIGKIFFVLEIIVCELVNVKFVLLRREYLWSAVYVLTNSLKTLHELKETFSNWNGFKVFSKYVKGGFGQISAVCGPVSNVASRIVLWNATF